jgi:hypothetical protein
MLNRYDPDAHQQHHSPGKHRPGGLPDATLGRIVSTLVLADGWTVAPFAIASS